MNKVILFDLIATQPYGTVKYHGGAEYSKIIFMSLLERIDEITIICFYDPNKELDSRITERISQNKVELIPANSLADVTEILKKHKIDVLYSGNGYEYGAIKIPMSVKLIVTIHGMRILEKPSDKFEFFFSSSIIDKVKWLYKQLFSKFYFIKKKRMIYSTLLQLLRNNSSIIVDSHHTKFSLLTYFPIIEKNRILVFYPPLKNKNKIKSTKKKENIILLLSADRWIKNSFRGILAIDQLLTQYRDFNAVIIGNVPQKIKKIIRHVDNFVFLDYVDESELEMLYSKAKILFYPSLNEGFGYPPVEAMRYDMSIVASSVSAISEVCGNAALYADPYSIHEMSTRLFEAIDSYEKCDLGKVRKRFSEIIQLQENDTRKIIDYIVQGR